MCLCVWIQSTSEDLPSLWRMEQWERGRVFGGGRREKKAEVFLSYCQDLKVISTIFTATMICTGSSISDQNKCSVGHTFLIPLCKVLPTQTTSQFRERFPRRMHLKTDCVTTRLFQFRRLLQMWSNQCILLSLRNWEGSNGWILPSSTYHRIHWALVRNRDGAGQPRAVQCSSITPEDGDHKCYL